MSSVVTIDGGNTVFQTTEAQRKVAKVHEFYIKFIAEGGASATSLKITFTVECGSSSTVIHIPDLDTPYYYQILATDPSVPRIELP